MTHVAKIADSGNVVYLGRYRTKEEARAAERAARDSRARTGRVERARSVYRRGSPNRQLNTDDAYLWFSSHFDNPRHELTGERGVMRAVLHAAIQDLQSRDASVRNGAVRWFRDDSRGYLYSFATICDEFGIPVRAARIDLLYGGKE